MIHPGELSSDIIFGADGIAEYVFGDRNKRRKIYHLVATNQLPFFKLGDTICSRKSKILAYFEEQEKASVARRIVTADAA